MIILYTSLIIMVMILWTFSSHLHHIRREILQGGMVDAALFYRRWGGTSERIKKERLSHPRRRRHIKPHLFPQRSLRSLSFIYILFILARFWSLATLQATLIKSQVYSRVWFTPRVSVTKVMSAPACFCLIPKAFFLHI